MSDKLTQLLEASKNNREQTGEVYDKLNASLKTFIQEAIEPYIHDLTKTDPKTATELSAILNNLLIQVGNMLNSLDEVKTNIQFLQVKNKQLADLQITTLIKLNKYLDQWI